MIVTVLFKGEYLLSVLELSIITLIKLHDYFHMKSINNLIFHNLGRAKAWVIVESLCAHTEKVHSDKV